MTRRSETRDPQALIYAGEVRDLYRRERARADELERAKDELEETHGRLVAEVKERELAEQALRQGQKMEAIGQLAGGIAHDFNNLLSVIITYAGFLEDELADSPSLAEEASEIKAAGRRAADLTRQLLAFSRKEPVDPRVVDLSVVVGEIGKMLSRIIGKGIHLRVSSEGELWPTTIDPGQLERIVMNLVVNARDAMPVGGELIVHTENRTVQENEATKHAGLRPGEYAAIVVTDSGTGMTEEVAARIFEPFFTTKPRESGTGLGLATVYGIVKQANGYILCESELERGTTFTIYLPRAMDRTGIGRSEQRADPDHEGGQPLAIEQKQRRSVGEVA